MKCERCNKQFDSFPVKAQNLCEECRKWLVENSKEADDCMILKCAVCHRFIGYLHIEDFLLRNKDVIRYIDENKIYFACPKCVARKRFDVYN